MPVFDRDIGSKRLVYMHGGAGIIHWSVIEYAALIIRSRVQERDGVLCDS